MYNKCLPVYDRHVGQWRLSDQVLGSGTTSTVILATHAKVPTLCAAVKVISRSDLLRKAEADPAALHLSDSVIHREILLMKVAAHERIVRLHDFVACGDIVYIIIEHAAHKTLLDLVRGHPSCLPPPLVTHIFAQVIHGLAYMHTLHIVHRDLKLENIFIFGPEIANLLGESKKQEPRFPGLSIKIGDFGLAHIADPAKLSTIFHGSPHYQAPEVWARVPHRALPTDIWSAGVVLYALLSRRVPFNLAALEATTHPVPESDIDMPLDTHMAYDAPEILPCVADDLLTRVFAFDPAARPTARAMLDDEFFAGLSRPTERRTDAEHALRPDAALYDIATLCVPPGRHIPRETFVGSDLERVVQERLESQEGYEMEKMWARRLGKHVTDTEAWEVAIVEQELTRMRRLGRKRMAEVLGRKEMNLAVRRPKLSTSLSLSSLRSKTNNGPPVHIIKPVASSIAGALQERREALLRRAYELGFGTDDLRAFAEEAGRIVRVAQEGEGCMGLQEIAREVERRGAVATCPSPSAATTLVAENADSGGAVKVGRFLDVPVVKVVAL